MNSQNTLSITNARKNIFELAEKVQKPGIHFTLTENGCPKVVMMSADEFDSWQETMEVLQEFPDLDKDVAETEKAFRTGEYKKWSTLNDLKKDCVFAVADKSVKKYGVHASCKTKRSKKHR